MRKLLGGIRRGGTGELGLCRSLSEKEMSMQRAIHH
jgi:hypothetical protein